MLTFNFGTATPIPYRLPDFGGLDIFLRSLGRITAETDEERMKDIIRNETLLLLSRHLSEHSGKTGHKALGTLHLSLGKEMSGELTSKYGFTVTVDIQSITPDTDSQALIDKLQRSHPEDTIRNMTIFDDVSYKGDCVPPLTSSPQWMPMGMNVSGEQVFDGGYAGRFDNPAKTGFIMPQAMQPDTLTTDDIKKIMSDARDYERQCDRIKEETPPEPQTVTGIMAGHRPKFCMHCGTPLSPTGNFCGECGKPIM